MVRLAHGLYAVSRSPAQQRVDAGWNVRTLRPEGNHKDTLGDQLPALCSLGNDWTFQAHQCSYKGNERQHTLLSE